MPSLRQVCTRYGVSMATAHEVYRLLEEQGVVTSRARSGYYVREGPPVPDSEPAPTQPPEGPSLTTSARLALGMLASHRRPRLINLGMTATPNSAVLPSRSLAATFAGAARGSPSAITDYGEPAGYLSLRSRIARRMVDAGCCCSPEDIILTNGCQEALVFALRALAKPGDAIAIESPTYFGLVQIVDALGMQALELPTHPREGVNLDALESDLKRYPFKACLLMPSCQNPLGASMPDENKRRLLALLDEAGIPLIEDDAMGDLSFATPRPKAAKAFDTNGNVLYCSSFAKTLGPGLRIGWIASAPYRDTLIYLKAQTNAGVGAWPQLGMAQFLARGGYARVVRKAVRSYRQRVNQVRQWILHYFPLPTRVTNPSGGFVLWVELPETVDGVELAKSAQEHGIGVAPGVLFSPRWDYRHHIRISVAQIEELKDAERHIQTLGRLAVTQMESRPNGRARVPGPA